MVVTKRTWDTRFVCRIAGQGEEIGDLDCSFGSRGVTVVQVVGHLPREPVHYKLLAGNIWGNSRTSKSPWPHCSSFGLTFMACYHQSFTRKAIKKITIIFFTVGIILNFTSDSPEKYTSIVLHIVFIFFQRTNHISFLILMWFLFQNHVHLLSRPLWNTLWNATANAAIWLTGTWHVMQKRPTHAKASP